MAVQIPVMHINPLGSYYVDLIEVTKDGQKIVETVNFTKRIDAEVFWNEKMLQAVAR